MNSDYLIHYGVLGMKWGIRRYQYKDGTRTPLGKRRERASSQNDGNGQQTHKWSIRKDRNETTGSQARGLDPNYSNETIKVLGNSENVEEKINKDYFRSKTDKEFEEKISKMSDKDLDSYISRTKKETEARNITETSDDIKAKEKAESDKLEAAAKKTAGKDAVKRMSDKEFNRYVSNMTDEDLQEFLTRTNKENQVRKNVKTANDEIKKQFENRQANLNDAKNIANDTASIARNMKNLNSNKSKKAYINPKNIKSMSDDELRAATNRAIIENNYLSATNQTMERGKRSIDWDKIATVSSVIATGIGIAASISAIKNRGRNE